VFYPHPGDGVSYPAAGLGIAALAIVTLLAVRAVRRRPYVTVGWLWFLVPLLPVIGILQVGFQAYADRYMYAPLVGLSILIVWGGSELASAMRLGASLQLGAAAALVVAFSVGTVRQVRHWQDSEAVFRHALDVTSENWLAHQNLGGVELRRKNIDAAGMHLAESVRIEPRNSATQIGYGSVLLYQGRRREGLEAMRKGVVFAAEIGEDLRAKLLAEIDGELSGGPPADTAAVIDRNLASADGLAMMEKTVRLRPQTPGIQGELGVALLRAGRNEEAEVVLREAIQREPENPTWRASHADVLVRLGRGPDAAAAYREALRLRSPWPEIENNLALLLASSSDPSLRDPAEAVRLAEAAVSGLGREDAGSLDTLAAAYEAAGRRKDALAAAREALTRAEAGGDPDAIAAVRSRIDALGGSPP
jgi:tetratricopeptide (TPR) repeat protein